MRPAFWCCARLTPGSGPRRPPGALVTNANQPPVTSAAKPSATRPSKSFLCRAPVSQTLLAGEPSKKVARSAVSGAPAPQDRNQRFGADLSRESHQNIFRDTRKSATRLEARVSRKLPPSISDSNAHPFVIARCGKPGELRLTPMPTCFTRGTFADGFNTEHLEKGGLRWLVVRPVRDWLTACCVL